MLSVTAHAVEQALFRLDMDQRADAPELTHPLRLKKIHVIHGLTDERQAPVNT